MPAGREFHEFFAVNDLNEFSKMLASTEEKVRRGESEVAEWTQGRNINPLLPTLPGGRDLSYAELKQLNAMMGDAYGFNALIDKLGLPIGTQGAGFTGKGMDREALHWVMPYNKGKRSYLRMAVGRETAATTMDPRLIALTQTSFQFREEESAKYFSQVLGRRKASTLIRSSGTRPKWDSIQRLMKQRENFLSDEGTRMIFDLETASLFPEHGIRQLSYRLTDAVGELVGSPKTLNFKNAIMGLGYYTSKVGEGMSPGEFAAGAGAFPQDETAEQLVEFFEQAGKSRYLIGQNAMFDVGMLQEIKKSTMYGQGEELMRKLSDEQVAGLTGRDALSVRVKRSADEFFAKAFSEDFVDTAAHARILMSEVDNVRLEVAPEIARRGEGKLFSLENIILQSSFMQDLVDHDVATREEIHKRLGGTGLHDADVDTWFTDMLSRLQRKVYGGYHQGLPEDGRSVLRAEAFGEEAFEKLYGRVGTQDEISELRERISRSSAITPFTNLNVADLEDLFQQQVISAEEWDAIKTGEMKVTPIQKMTLMTRDLDMKRALPEGVAAGGQVARDVAKNTGLFGQFIQDRGIIDKKGFLNAYGRFPTAEEWAAVQSALQKAGYAFPGMSFSERLISSMIGTAPSVYGDAATSMRLAVGETVPLGSWIPSELGAFPAKKGAAARSVAIPIDLLRQMEEEGVIGGTKIGAAYERTGVQWLHMSPFQYRRDKKVIEDVALTVRGAVSTDTAVAGGQIERIVDWLRANANVTEKEGERIAAGLAATGATTGIQVATLGGGSQTPQGTAVFNALKHMGLDVDRLDSTGMRLPLLPPEQGPGVTPEIRTGAAYDPVVGRIDAPDTEEKILRELRSSEGLMAEMEQQVAGDPRFLSQVDQSKVGVWAAGRGRTGWDAPAEWWSKHISPNLRPGKIAAAGAIAGLGYYLFKKRGEDQATQEPLDQMPYEYSGDYNEYRQDVGLAPMSSAQISRTRNRDPLSTAGIPAYLDSNKTGHHRMGPFKDGHLFGNYG